MVSRTMQALNYVGPFKVKVQEVEMPRLEHPDDIIVKVTSVSSPVRACAEAGQSLTRTIPRRQSVAQTYSELWKS
jgi:hypothetical protein